MLHKILMVGENIIVCPHSIPLNSFRVSTMLSNSSSVTEYLRCVSLSLRLKKAIGPPFALSPHLTDEMKHQFRYQMARNSLDKLIALHVLSIV